MKLEKKHYIWGGIILALILIFVFRNQLMSLFGIGSTKRMQLFDANGNPTGRYVNVPASSSSRVTSCCAVGQFFVGNCKFPITKNDHVSPCGGA